MFDRKAILQDADIESVLTYCNIKWIPKYGKYIIECQNHKKRLGHIDRHLGNCQLDQDGTYYCHACHDKGTLFDIVMVSMGCTFPEACNIIAECSTGTAEMYKMNEHAETEARENLRLKEYFELLGLSQKRANGVNGSIITEVYTEMEAEAFRECGYSVEKEGYDIVPLSEEEIANGETYDPVRWLVYQKESPINLMKLRKSNFNLFKDIIERKENEALEMIELMMELAEQVTDQKMYREMISAGKEKKNIIKQGHDLLFT